MGQNNMAWKKGLKKIRAGDAGGSWPKARLVGEQPKTIAAVAEVYYHNEVVVKPPNNTF